MTNPKASPSDSPSPCPGPSVVVVDDDPNLLEALEGLLREEGCAVEGFTDPSSALERLRGGPRPDLVLVDCVMPRLTGGELCDALAADGFDARVVLMTALSDPSFCVDMTKASGVLNKPFQIEDLLAEIRVAESARARL